MISFRSLKTGLPSAVGAAAVLLATVLFLVFPARYAASVFEGAALWATSVLPATLPLLFLTSLLIRQSLFVRLTDKLSPAAEKLLRISGAGLLCALLSALSGYPVGAKMVAELKKRGRIGEREVFRTACISTTTGPAFLVGAVGAGMLQSAAVGWLLYGAHLMGVYAVLFLLPGRPDHAAMGILPQKASVPETVSSSVLSVLCVGGAIALFYAFGDMAADIMRLFGLPDGLAVPIQGLLEMTSGCARLAPDTSPLSLALIAFFVTFGGFCVLVQQFAYLREAGVPAGKFTAVKLIQGLVSGAAAFGLAHLL